MMDDEPQGAAVALEMTINPSFSRSSSSPIPPSLEDIEDIPPYVEEGRQDSVQRQKTRVTKSDDARQCLLAGMLVVILQGILPLLLKDYFSTSGMRRMLCPSFTLLMVREGWGC